MKIGIYNPYLDSLGGGERYMLTIASHWSKTHDVDVFWDHDAILEKAVDRFSLDFSRVSIVPNLFQYRTLSKLRGTSSYDLILMLSDGSIPMSRAKHNILHFQMPFPSVAFPFWKRRMIDAIVCNSEFTKQAIDPCIGEKAVVIYPPVPVDAYAPAKKTNTILSVGRFSAFHHAKKQDVLIEFFRKGLEKNYLKGMRLVFAGGLLKSDEPYFLGLKTKAEGLPIEFYPNCPFDQLRKLYGESRIYWHAAGFGEHNPLFFEHFGISTVEAMASGSVPLVYGKGGQKEIVNDGEEGFLWYIGEELLEKTEEVIRSKAKEAGMVKKAKKRAEIFGEKIFCSRFDELIKEFI